MSQPDSAAEIARLRALNLSPKQIARQLGLRPAEVTAIIKAQAETTERARAATGDLPPVAQCLINANAARHLLDPQEKKDELEEDGVGGLAQIFVVRSLRNQYLVGSYLVDYWCLGVKDALGPRKLDRTKYENMVRSSYGGFGQDYQEISLEQAQAIIFGAVDYAASLGLQPHPDFQLAKAHLGDRLDTTLKIEFGRNGKPFYISGPYDNPQRIIATLTRSVGEGNFDYVINAGF